MIERCIAIVGAGPMCVYALERLAALLPVSHPRIRARICIFDRSGKFGAGEVHNNEQPESSMMNRAAGQISFAADEGNHAVRQLLPKASRPTFAQWCTERFSSTQDSVFLLAAHDVPSRKLYGMALRDAFERHVAILTADGFTSVALYANEVNDVRPNPSDSARFDICIEDLNYPIVSADHVLFVTGHAHNFSRNLEDEIRTERSYVATPYPLQQNLSLARIPAGSVVALDGLGLTAIDVALYLTEGRGGRFEQSGGGNENSRLAYVPSGQEPRRIIGFSRSGFLPMCRPRNGKIGRPELEHRGRFLTKAAVDHLRVSAGVKNILADGTPVLQLDFRTTLMPLVLLEMAYVYFRTILGMDRGDALVESALPRYHQFLNGITSGEEDLSDHLIAPLRETFYEQYLELDVVRNLKDESKESIARSLDFDWRSILTPFVADGSLIPLDWHQQVVKFLRDDIRNAREGNLKNPIKAACDGVWRDLRSVIAYAADKGGLTPTSHREFGDVFLSYYSRLSNGPGIRPMEKVLALLEHGLLDVSIGPDAESQFSVTDSSYSIKGKAVRVSGVDTLVTARLASFSASKNSSPLYKRLLSHGLVREWRNPGLNGAAEFVPGGLDLTDNSHPITQSGIVETRLTFLGSPTDGVNFFQSSAARPQSDNAVINDMAKWIIEILESCGEHPPFRSSTRTEEKIMEQPS